MTAPLISTAASRYKNVGVKTCSPAQLVAMLFDGAIRFSEEAIAALDAGDRSRFGERIGRAHEILAYLAATLDREKSPELSDNLEGLYAWCMQRLLQANLNRSRDEIREVAGLITPLRDAWWKIAREG